MKQTPEERYRQEIVERSVNLDLEDKGLSKQKIEDIEKRKLQDTIARFRNIDLDESINLEDFPESLIKLEDKFLRDYKGFSKKEEEWKEQGSGYCASMYSNEYRELKKYSEEILILLNKLFPDLTLCRTRRKIQQDEEKIKQRQLQDVIERFRNLDLD